MSTLRVATAGRSQVTDLGRYGYAHLGVQSNGAADQRSARTANVLVGNAPDAPVIEITTLIAAEFVTDERMLVAATGAVGRLLLDGAEQPACTPIVTWPGARIRLEPGTAGIRAYLGVHGSIVAETQLGSVASDRLIGCVNELHDGDDLPVRDGRVRAPLHLPLFRSGLRPLRLGNDWTLDVLPGPDADDFPRFAESAASEEFHVGAQSDHIGVRLDGATFPRTSTHEVLSRGVPLGAIEVPPSGSLIALLRGRPLTAGYPIPAVVARSSHHLLGQLRPGDSVRLRAVGVRDSLDGQLAFERELRALAERCASMFEASAVFPSCSASHAAPAA
ncbi:biotin-dependent carboxyltransferase family protein [Mycetocola reblochoni]|uniref:Allophanate hydrolase 2 subunit 2 n=1 Tax=Mycetocola reblochoni REB411 TaxID=1255698 RepID=A0A1R4IQ49_9MICO|nr:biotin-dependent carboxyltransferase family protein [Mycetocola reblochoni]SJN21725.1 Allophanate hydrolase 2 subunit 2 [Mycetocola reblochoni REB411]